MSRFVNKATGVTFSVDDSKDGRFAVGYEPADEKPAPKATAKKATAKKAAAPKPEK